MASTIEPPTRERDPAGEHATARKARRRRPAHELEGRRLQPAGIGVLVIVIAALVGALLNAQGLRKTAHIQPEGAGRELALALTKPLVSVSHALYLDRPRQELKEALGRGDDDVVDETVVLPPPLTADGAGAQEATPASPSEGQPGEKSGAGAGPQGEQPGAEEALPKVAFTPEEKMRIWIAGDSLAITPGQSMTRILPGTKVIKPVGSVDGRVSTGLERPDVFNWFTYVPKELKRLDPDVVVFTFGANDDHDYMTGVPEGVELDDFASKSWVKEYRRRVGGLMDLASRGGRFVVWIGIPITRSSEQSERFRILNTIYATEAAKRPGRVAYVDTYKLFQDENGDYADYLENDKGELVRVRAPDGVHFETTGGDWIARQVLKALREQFDLTSWRKAKPRGPRAEPTPTAPRAGTTG